MAAGIFISYRRDDSRHAAGRMADDLAHFFGSEHIFRDIEGIDPGVDFTRALEKALASCVVMLVLIGPRWMQIQDPQGQRRLEQPDDWVRQEIASALERDVRVVPVLLEGARLPEAGALPAELRSLVRRQALELSDARWRGDLQRLVETLSKVPGLEPKDQPARSPVPVPATAPSRGGHRSMLIGAVLGVVGLLLLAGLLFESESSAPIDADSRSSASPSLPISADPVAAPAPDGAPAPTPGLKSVPTVPNVSGMWRTNTGEVYYFDQDGRDVSFTAEAGGVMMGEGQGRFEGALLRLMMTMHVNGVVIGSAQCDMRAAPNQQSYTGMCNGPNGPFPAQFFR